MLRPYQVAAIDNIRRELRAGHRRVLLVSPTGSGKTQIAAEMIRSAVALGNQVLVVAHRRELVYQVRDRLLRDHALEAGIIMAGNARRDEYPVQVASIQTLLRRSIPPARLLICDEAHHAAADSWRKLLEALPTARVVGLTATPWRLDNRGLRDQFDSMVVAATPRQLMDLGFLCGATGHAYVHPDFGDVAMKGGDYDPAGLSLAYEQSKVLGDIVDRWFTHCGPTIAPPHGRRTILFASSIGNSRDLIERFRSRGVTAEHLDYHTKPQPRREIIDRVRSGEITIISNVGILGEGVDVPELECAILARPSKSVSVYLQQVGRVLRPAPGKLKAIIHDHAGAIAAHGFWDEERDYTLTVTRKKTEQAAPTKTCPECFCVCLGGVGECPECGYIFPRKAKEDEDAEHKELTLEEMRALAVAKKDRNQLLMILMAEAKARGYRPGWVLRRVADELGEDFPFPRSWWKSYVTGTKGDYRWKPS